MNLGSIGIEPEVIEVKLPDGPSLPICIKGSLQSKTKTMFKAKITKNSKNIYKGVFIRSIGYFNYMYDVETTIFIASIVKPKSPHKWIDKNEQRIKERINECITTRRYITSN